MDLTGGVPLPRVTFEPRFLSQECIFGKNSLAKGIFSFEVPSQVFIFDENPKNWHLGAKLASVLGEFILEREYLS